MFISQEISTRATGEAQSESQSGTAKPGWTNRIDDRENVIDDEKIFTNGRKAGLRTKKQTIL